MVNVYKISSLSLALKVAGNIHPVVKQLIKSLYIKQTSCEVSVSSIYEGNTLPMSTEQVGQASLRTILFSASSYDSNEGARKRELPP